MDEIAEDIPTLKANAYTFIQMPSGNSKVVTLKPGSVISLGKFGSFNADALIGDAYGHSYEILSKDKIRIVQNTALTEVLETNANNQNIVDDPTTQKLTAIDIEQMKAQGLEGELNSEDIIKKMVDSHGAFDQKTEFSKAKYIVRKQKKFSKIFTPIRPTLFSVCQYFFTKNPDKIRHLRIDTLSQMLSYANVQSNAKMLVIDDTQGLVVAAVAERMGGYGTIVGIHDSELHNYDVLRYMNFSKHVLSTIHSLSWRIVDRNDPQPTFDYKDTESLDEKEKKRYEHQKASFERLHNTKQLLWSGEFDGIMIASAYQPESILERFMPLMSGSRPIVIFHAHKEILVQTALWMKRHSECLNPQITESWLREYQVLPGRMHPNMNMSGGGGYILTATRVLDEDIPSTETTSNKRQKSANGHQEAMDI